MPSKAVANCRFFLNAFLMSFTIYLAINLYAYTDEANQENGSVEVMVPLVLMLIATFVSTWCGTPAFCVLYTMRDRAEGEAVESLCQMISGLMSCMCASLATFGLVGFIWFAVREGAGDYVGNKDDAWMWYLYYFMGPITVTINLFIDSCLLGKVISKEIKLKNSEGISPV